MRGNLLTLIHGLQYHTPPSGGRLRGDEFKSAVTVLRSINGNTDDSPPPRQPQSSAPAADHTNTSPADPPPENIPLKDQEKTLALVNLWEDCIMDVAEMSPPAAAYFRQRPWLTPDVCRKWKMGYLPRDERSLMRGMIVYAHQNEAGDILSYSGRNIRFDEQWQQWLADGRPEKKRPIKHKYVKGYHKGLQLYGEQADRLADRRLKESLGKLGLVVVEGQNDVIRLDCLGVAAVGLCSNKASDEQIDKLERIARQAAQGRVVLIPDNDAEGEAGFKELLWSLASRGLTVRLGWSRQSHSGQFDGQQPEHLTDEQWNESILPLLR